ncbi:hypothetical protein [Streptomyces roseolus]|uniref:hypothetical protein n=1 Tax=Streptomyces roseolus TaxID=67358 RepID=UPI00378D7819
MYLWLFEGDEPTDKAFVGSIMIPDRPGVTPTAYDAGGGFAGSVYDEKEALLKLVERAAH